MFQYLLFRTRYRFYLKNDHGIKKFAEMCMGRLIRRATKKSAFYREMNENLLVEKANLRMRRDELYQRPTLEGNRFFSVRSQYWANNFLIVVIIAVAILLNVLSVEALIQGAATSIGTTLRWVAAVLLALVLTGGGMVIAQRLIGAALPPKEPRERAGSRRTAVSILWGLLLIGMEVAIVGLSEVQATVVSEELNSTLIYYGYIIASTMLPIIAGALFWHTMGFIDRYKTTMVLRQIESRLAQIDSILRQNDEFESNFYKMKSISFWEIVNNFKTIKDHVNQKRGIVETLTGHFAQSYDAFQAEANKRYTQDIRDLTARSMRKLELVEKGGSTRVGSKLERVDEGDRGPSGQRTQAPEIASVEQPSGSEDYLSLQPVR